MTSRNVSLVRGLQHFLLDRPNVLCAVVINDRLNVIKVFPETDSKWAFIRQAIHEVTSLSNRLFSYGITVKQEFPFSLEIVFANHRCLQTMLLTTMRHFCRRGRSLIVLAIAATYMAEAAAVEVTRQHSNVLSNRLSPSH